MSSLGYSQTTFPASVIIDNDSVVCLTYQQVGNINEIFVENEYLKETVDTLQRVHQLDSILLQQHMFQLYYYQAIDSAHQQQVISWQEVHETQKRLSEEALKKQKRTYIKYGAIGTAAAFLIGILVGR